MDKNAGASEPQTWLDALTAWDNDIPITSIEMGGIGPSYEQAIQVGVMELMRAIGPPLERKEVLEDIDGYLHKRLQEVSKSFTLGLSGAQAGAIKHLAHGFVTKGYRSTIESYPSERRIIISQWWPTTRRSSGDDNANTAGD
jgi:hypothetical protein